MTRASIPLSLFNPGQVFGALGFLEAAHVLCGGATGGFDWTNEEDVRFILETQEADQNPVAVVLEFLANAEIRSLIPKGYKDKETVSGSENTDDNHTTRVDWFPMSVPESMTLPVRLTRDSQSLDITHWSDASSRNNFKLYAGNRSATGIVHAMLSGTREKSIKGQKEGKLKTKGHRFLWENDA